MESGISPTTLAMLWFDSINRVNNAPAAPRKRTCSMPRSATTPHFAARSNCSKSWNGKRSPSSSCREPFRPVGPPVAAQRVSQSDQLEASKEGMEYQDGPSPGTLVLVRRQRSLLLKINRLAKGARRSWNSATC